MRRRWDSARRGIAPPSTIDGNVRLRHAPPSRGASHASSDVCRAPQTCIRLDSSTLEAAPSRDRARGEPAPRPRPRRRAPPERARHAGAPLRTRTTAPPSPARLIGRSPTRSSPVRPEYPVPARPQGLVPTAASCAFPSVVAGRVMAESKRRRKKSPARAGGPGDALVVDCRPRRRRHPSPFTGWVAPRFGVALRLEGALLVWPRWSYSQPGSPP